MRRIRSSVFGDASGDLTMRPRHARIPFALSYGGDSRTSLYRKATQTPGLFVKDGRTTFVDMDIYDQVLSKRPPAVIKLSLDDEASDRP
jgi:hypothetical protein